MKGQGPLERRVRARGARAVVAVLLGILGLAFFRAQVLRSSTWALRSESNRLRPLPVPAPRGTIFDREGRVIADVVPGHSISLLPAPPGVIRATLERMQAHISLSDERIEELMATARRNPREPLLVDVNASFQEVSSLEERRAAFPDVFIEMRPRRRYPAGSAAAHVIGHVGEITAEELESERFQAYEQGMIVGKEGIERQYDEALQGSRGVRYVEVDAVGRIVGSFQGQEAIPTRPGEDIQLNLDLELMSFVHRAFPDTMRGAVVALDVEDGGVLALYSSPAFDPNDFIGGIDTETWRSLSQDPAQPLFNRAVQGLYPPASTWKLASAAIGLELGVVTPTEEMPLPCTGGMQFGNRYFRCWEPDGHGYLDLAGAIQHSCDVYFYQLGRRIGLQGLLEEGTRIGFSRQCGIDLPQEQAGLYPESTSYWERRFGYRPTEAEALNLAIGQGPNSQTPLKMAQFYLALARDGSAPAPRLRQGMEEGPAWRLDLSDESLDALLEGLRRVTRPGGTAHLASLEHWDLMGKTGTAQNAQDPDRDHAWFAGMAGPLDGDPEVVVVAIVEFGEHGSTAAAPLVAKTADFWLRKKHGIPVDTIQTLGEHYRTGTPAPWARRFQSDGRATGGDGGPGP